MRPSNHRLPAVPKLRRALLACAVVGLFGYGCQKVSWFHHKPTEEALRTYALDDPQLAPFKAGDVVVVPTIVQGYARIKLTFLASGPTEVKLARVSVDDKTVEIGETLQVDKKASGKDVYLASKEIILKGVADGAPFDELGRDGYNVVVEVDGAKLAYDFPHTTSHEIACAGW